MKPILNKEQQEAIQYISGPLIIIAGAGTGKTKVVSEKIKYLIINKLAKPNEILALTFNEKAASELQFRVDEIMDYGYLDTQISTFHSFCQIILEQYGLDIGLSNRFNIATQTDSWILFKKNIHLFNLDYYQSLGNPTKHIQSLIQHFSKCKDELISPNNYQNIAHQLINSETDDGEKLRLNELIHCYKIYNQLLLDHNYLDFGDLIFYTNLLLEKRPTILKKLQAQYKYILIDEFQDVNKAQYELVKKLTGENNQLTVVGDDDQSIYAFRGASVKNILNFKDDFKNTKEIVLKYNYRSNQDILDKSYQLIQNNNPERLEIKLNINKKLIAANNGSNNKSTVIHSHLNSLTEEIYFVIKEIVKIKNENSDSHWDDFAILIRANSHADPFIEELDKNNIPYEYLAASGLFRQPIIIDCLNFYKLLDNYKESQAIFRLLNLKFLNINYKDLHNFVFYTKRKGLSYYEALQRIDDTGISDKHRRSFTKLLEIIDKAIENSQSKKPSELLFNFLNDSGYLKYLLQEEKKSNQDIIRQIGYLNQFFDYVKNYESMVGNVSVKELNDHLNQATDSGDTGIIKQPENTLGSIKILTAHLSKGMEFDYVFIINAVEERFPSRNKGGEIPLPNELFNEDISNTNKINHIAEERRLFYVAMTRAKKRLYITSADNYGGTRTKKISRFLNEMDFNISNKSISKDHNHIPTFSPNCQPKTISKIPANIQSFSYTQITQYDKCPYQFWLNNILKLPSSGKPHLSFGSTIHNTLEKFYLKIITINNLSLYSNNTKSVKIIFPSLDDLISIYNQEWIDEWYTDDIQRTAYYEKGKDMLINYFYKNKDNISIPIATELQFKIKIQNHTISGRIDRIDIKPNNQLEIIDYKTGSAKEKIDKDNKNQLLIYQLAVNEMEKFNKIGKIEQLTNYYLDNGSTISFIGQDKDIIKLKEKIINTINQIRNENFQPDPDQIKCNSCDFKEICDFRI